MDALSSSQRAALRQVLELTDNGDEDVAIGVLSSVDWDVQVSEATLLSLLHAVNCTYSARPR